MNKLNVFVSGGGVAGITAAHFLARAGHAVTVVERTAALRDAGQGLDMTGSGITVIQRMQLEAQIRSQTTKEEGGAIVDSNNNFRATFPVEGLSFTNEIEITRGNLVKCLYDKVKKEQPDVKFLFGNSISSITKPSSDDGKVSVDFSKGESAGTHTYDLVIGAEGQRSRTRKLVWPADEAASAIDFKGVYIAFFSLPWTDTDGTWSRWHTTTGRRAAIIRPHGDGKRSSGYLAINSPSPELAAAAASNDMNQQKHPIPAAVRRCGMGNPAISGGYDECGRLLPAESRTSKVGSLVTRSCGPDRRRSLRWICAEWNGYHSGTHRALYPRRRGCKTA